MIERILARGRGDTANGASGAAPRADDNIDAARNRIQIYNASGAPTMAWLRERKVRRPSSNSYPVEHVLTLPPTHAQVPIIELDCSGTPDEVWGQLLAVGRLMRYAVTQIPPPPPPGERG